MRIRGDIFEAANRAANAGRHYIVFFSDNNDQTFIGGMVTHSPSAKNVAMNKLHIEEKDSNGIKYKFQYDNTYLVKAKLKKFENWRPFTKIGELTDEGVRFLEIQIGDLEAETWEEYCIRTNF